MAQDIARVVAAARGLTSGSDSLLSLDPSGAVVVIDFMQKAMLDGRGFQVRVGSISAPVTGDGTGITDTAAEACIDAATGHVIMPVQAVIAIDVWTGDDSEGALKSVAAVSSAGTAFVPLPLKLGGTAAVTTARVSGTGGVTVTAETVTTTRAHAYWSAEEGGTPATDVAIHTNPIFWQPKAAPPLVGPACFYLQEAIATYFATIDYLEFTAAQLGY